MRKMFHGILAVACLAVSAVATSTRAADIVTVDQRLKAEAEAGRFTGLALVTIDGKTVYERTFGSAARAGKHLTAQSPWRLASITKQITAVMVMQAVERGKLSLDSKLGELLPAFSTHPAGAVTVRQLLQHTSGLANPSDGAVSKEGFPVFYSSPQADHSFCASPPRAAPGEFNYNNCDYYVLADILEKVTGRSYAQLLQADIVGPLKLKTMHLYRPDEREVFIARDSKGGGEPAFQMSSYEAAAGISASAYDLSQFDNALMAGKLLSSESLKVLWHGEPSLGYVALGAWSYTVKPVTCPAPMTLIERRGGVGDVATLNLMWPERKASLILFSATDATDWGQFWQDSGLMRDVAVAAWCR